ASRSVIWAATAHPASPISRNARPATDRTAGSRFSPRRSSRDTTGERSRVRSTARASGTKIRWPQYRPATTSPAPPRPKNAPRARATPGDSAARSAMGLPPVRGRPAEQGPDLPEQAGDLDRLGVVLVAPGGQGLLPVPGHRVGRQGDHRDVPGLRVGLELARRLPPIQDRQAHVHQDEIRSPRPRAPEPPAAAPPGTDLE